MLVTNHSSFGLDYSFFIDAYLFKDERDNKCSKNKTSVFLSQPTAKITQIKSYYLVVFFRLAVFCLFFIFFRILR